ncbi:hypothetical protein LIER_31447 [Lithospermum erythrorhizon]|uniref:Uncharacterized protein n=1 Tax=Lithospermum erythrorhizon TaxID=34254 RepID=A0AAV3RR16_LITER
MCYQMLVPSLGREPENSKKRDRENNPEVMSTKGETQKENDNSPKERESLRKPVPHEEIVADEELEKTFRVGMMLEENHIKGLIRLIQKYRDIFAWGPEDMPRINTSVALHQLTRGIFATISRRVRRSCSDGSTHEKSHDKSTAIRKINYLDMELNEFNISYDPRTSLKAQALADFVIKCTGQTPQIVSGPSNFEPGMDNPEWIMFVDGARNEKGSGAGILIRGP